MNVNTVKDAPKDLYEALEQVGLIHVPESVVRKLDDDLVDNEGVVYGHAIATQHWLRKAEPELFKTFPFSSFVVLSRKLHSNEAKRRWNGRPH